MKKNVLRLLCLMLCAALLCIPAMAAETQTPQLTPSEGPVRVWGTLTRLSDGGLLVKNSNESDPLNEVILHGENIICLDAVTGEPMDVDALKDGESIYAWVGPVMTMSLPPQATAILIVANIPADFGAPQYYEISSVTPQAMIAIYPPPALTWTEVTTTDGKTLKITDEATLTPYLTKNNVRLEDLVPGTRILVWTGMEGDITKVLVFPYEYSSYITGGEDGLLTVGGQVLSVKATLAGKETMLPVRAVADALGLKVYWDAETGANVARADGSTVFSVDPGKGSVCCGDGSTISASSILKDGITYLSADTLIQLLDLYVAG